MRCVDCRYSLVCYAGRLDGDEGQVTICPSCHRITLLQPEGAYVTFKCEQRNWTPEQQRTWNKRKETAKLRQVVMQFAMHDTGPGLTDQLIVRECTECVPGLVERNLNVSLKPVDLDEEAAMEAELAPNPLGLRHG